MRDRNGDVWLTLKEAAEQAGVSTETIRAWRAQGLPSQLVAGKRWVPEVELFARLRASLAESQRVKTRWQNRA